MRFPHEDQIARERQAALEQAIQLAQHNLLRLQHDDGYWAGELIADATLCSDYVFYMHWAQAVDPVLEEKCVAHIQRRQLPEGGWAIYHGGPPEINASIKAYTALKLAGLSAAEPRMQEARATILRLGGVPRTNTYTKFYLAMLGQFPWSALPSIPPELVLLPTWLPFHLYKLSSWSRAILVPMAILHHHKPTRELPPEKQLHELYPAGAEEGNLALRPERSGWWGWSWRNFFLGVDALLKSAEQQSFLPLRKRALRAAETWMTDRMGEGSDGLAAVFPAMLNSIMALETLGRAKDDPLLQKARRTFEELFVEDPEDFRIQPCLSPVWDTAINIIALVESGFSPDEPAVQNAARWLSSKEVRRRGDWTVNNPHAEASGWAFEFNNDFYPDTDDTAMVLIALRYFRPLNDQPSTINPQQFQRALDWLLSFQCKDGGWAAFDRELMDPWLEAVPFADHNAILDPTCSDLTGRTLELLGTIGHPRDSGIVQRGIAHLQRTQEPDGSWYGRWGVNYLYGTWQVLRGLGALGVDMEQRWILRARDWLRSCQNEDGGWGETCASYENPALKGKGPSTASQTAWALMGLIAAGDGETDGVARGLDFLLRTQNADGSWSEPEITGTGFPRVFYLKYDMYRNNFPLLALATYRRHRANISLGNAEPEA